MLLRHEFAYVLGQLGDASAISPMRAVLLDEAEDEVVRHEAAEALAALADGPQSAAALAELAAELEALAQRTESEPLRHTCELAVAGLRKRLADPANEARPVCVCQYTSKDPAEGLAGAGEADLPSAAAVLSDTGLPLYERYEGLFTLRNVGGPRAAEALSAALLGDQTSAVLRHEVAFVLGQMELAAATDALIAALSRCQEHGMVRHEAAIALGAIGTPEAEAVLKAFSADPDLLVAESCQVALETAAYWRAWQALEDRLAATSGAG